MAVMDKATVVRTCKELGFYSTPELNERLYLHSRGFGEIAGLDEFTGVKSLFLESNCLTEIKGLENNVNLSALYLAKNCITHVSGVSHLRALDKIDLSDNTIKTVTGLAGLSITTLSLSRNLLKTAADLKDVLGCRKVRVLDLSFNRIDDPAVIDILAELPELSVLKLEGNPLAKTMKLYRKTLTRRLRELKALDDMPVTAVDHAAAAAYFEGGLEAERRVRQQFKEEEKRKAEEQRLRFEEACNARRKARATEEHTEYWKLNHADGKKEKPGFSYGEDLVASVWDANVPNSDGVVGHRLELKRDALRQKTLAAANRPPQGLPHPSRPPDVWSEGSDWDAAEYDSSADDGCADDAVDYGSMKTLDAAIETAWARGDREAYARLVKQAGRDPEPAPAAAPPAPAAAAPPAVAAAPAAAAAPASSAAPPAPAAAAPPAPVSAAPASAPPAPATAAAAAPPAAAPPAAAPPAAAPPAPVAAAPPAPASAAPASAPPAPATAAAASLEEEAASVGTGWRSANAFESALLALHASSCTRPRRQRLHWDPASGCPSNGGGA
eukprot:TRINITY_DN2964_c0_g1_i1.p1 TRINITY_DN2964_c0_g1~~TRINITY_DN2964_c0_g1_i1.p1  ORF type:complete len:555 (+),score=172.76 TRINITY_DN2964_c0_g1_i1:88-1752(+)